MSTFCFVKSCNTSSGRFYKLPLGKNNKESISELSIRWLQLIGRSIEDVKFDNTTKNIYQFLLCEKHFSDKQFEVRSGTRQLKLNAVPDLYLFEAEQTSALNLPNSSTNVINGDPVNNINSQLVMCARNSQNSGHSKPVVFNIQLIPDKIIQPSSSAAEQKIILQSANQYVLPQQRLVLRQDTLPCAQPTFKSNDDIIQSQNKIIIRTMQAPLQHSMSNAMDTNENTDLCSSKQLSQTLTRPVQLQQNKNVKGLSIFKRSPNIPAEMIVKPKVSLIPKTQALITPRINIPAEERKQCVASNSPKEQCSNMNNQKTKKIRLLAPKPHIPVAQLCRLCATTGSDMLEIYSQLGEQLKLPFMISITTQLQISKNDELPLKVCLKCINKLHICNDIRTEFTEANHKLTKLLKVEQEMEAKSLIKPIPLILIENDPGKNPGNNEVHEEPTKLRFITEKLVHVDKNLPPPQQIAQVIETVKAGLGTDSNSSLSPLYDTVTKVRQKQVRTSNKPYECFICKEKLSDLFTLIQHQLRKFQCRTCKLRFCSFKSRLAHYKELHSAKKSCDMCKLQFTSKHELDFHITKCHSTRCEYCATQFTSKAALACHIKKTIIMKKYVCGKCNIDCKIESHSVYYSNIKICTPRNRKLTSEHETGLHSKTRTTSDHSYTDKQTLMCEYCGKNFVSFCKLKRHMVFHMEKQIQCPLCPRKFTIKTELKYHLEVHSNDRKFECDYCNSKFLHKVHLTKHIKNKHLQKNYFLCELCYARCETKEEIEEHCASHPLEDKVHHVSPYKIVTPFPCHICNKFYVTKDGLDQHLQRHKDKELGLYLMCEYCGQNFASKSRLQTHLNEHSVITEPMTSENKSKPTTTVKRYSCKVCPKKFFTNVQLLAHMTCHTGVKPFKCSFCEATFTTKMNKNNHELRHKGIKNYTCEYCQKAFYGHYNLVLHLRTHTKEKPYKCTYCPKAFPRRSNLTAHVRIHTGDRPYTCDICGHAFSQKTSRDKHVLVHTQGKMYNCSQCDYACNKKCELTEHSENVHGNYSITEDMFLSKDNTHDPQHAQEAEFQIQIIEQEVVTYD